MKPFLHFIGVIVVVAIVIWRVLFTPRGADELWS